MSIVNETRGSVIAGQVTVANTFLSRFVGLLNRNSLSGGEALIITGCTSIHMFFMKFPIDAVFVDRAYRVVGLAEHIKPFQLSKIFWNANFVIELPAGTIRTSQTRIGDTLGITGLDSSL